LIGELLEASPLCDFDSIPALVAQHGAGAGLHDVKIYLADRQQAILRPLPLIPEEILGEAELRIDSTMAGLAFRNAELIGPHRSAEEEAADALHRFWLPLLDGTERLGVLEVGTRDVGEDALALLRRFAALVSLLIVSKRAHSDTYARIVRTRRMTLAAEVQWTLLPPLAFANQAVVIGAALEPAYEVGGDAFDYALSRRSVYLSIFDAMGHDTASGLTASIAVASWRNNRRHGMGLADISEAINRDVAEQFDGSRFVTGILASLDLVTGMLDWVNRGHHPPLVIRGGRWATTLERRPVVPMGFRLPEHPVVYRHQLEPGDRLLFYTDGIPEARGPNGKLFGIDRFVDFVIRHEADGLSVPETLRRLMKSVLEHQNGRLQDDAAVLLAEWRGDGERREVF
jgi:serine phosphatase RsbU (regulator of sigma subunit)